MKYSEISTELSRIEKETEKLDKISQKLKLTQKADFKKCLMDDIYSIAKSVSLEINGKLVSVYCDAIDSSECAYFTLEIDIIRIDVHPNKHGKCMISVYNGVRVLTSEYAHLVSTVRKLTLQYVDLMLEQYKSDEKGE